QTETAIVGARESLQSVRGSAQRAQVIDTLASLTALRDATEQPVTVISSGNATIASPHPGRNAVLALILAALLAPPLVLLFDRSDRILRRPRELERLSGVPLLASLPKRAFAVPWGKEAEGAFQRVRDSVIFFDPDSRPRTVAIISALEDEGRTTVAAGLACA